MKIKSRFVSLLVVLLVSAPLLSAGEVERLRALVSEQEMQIQQLELKIAQLTNTPTPVITPATPATPAVVSKATSEDGLVPTAATTAETCPEPATKESPESYTIQPGDNMSSIARKHGTTSATLNKLNGLKSGSIIRPGQKLKLPAAPVTASVEPEHATAPAAIADAKPSIPESEPPVADLEPTLAPPTASSSSIKHTVALQETFYSIAKKYNVTVDALIIKNPSVNPATLRLGQVVQIPGNPKTSDMSSAPTPELELELEPEPSLSLTSHSNIPVSSQSTPVSQQRAADKPVKITKEISYSEFAKNYNTTPARLDQLNGLRLDPTTILAQGSELYIPAQP